MAAPWPFDPARRPATELMEQPEDAALDVIVEDRVGVVFFLVAESGVELAAAFCFLVPRQRDLRARRRALRVGDLRRVGYQQRANTWAQMVQVVAFVFPVEACFQALGSWVTGIF